MRLLLNTAGITIPPRHRTPPLRAPNRDRHVLPTPHSPASSWRRSDVCFLQRIAKERATVHYKEFRQKRQLLRAHVHLSQPAATRVQLRHHTQSTFVRLPFRSQRPRRLVQRTREGVRCVYFSDQALRHVQVLKVAVVVGKRIRFGANHRNVVVGGSSQLPQQSRGAGRANVKTILKRMQTCSSSLLLAHSSSSSRNAIHSPLLWATPALRTRPGCLMGCCMRM